MFHVFASKPSTDRKYPTLETCAEGDQKVEASKRNKQNKQIRKTSRTRPGDATNPSSFLRSAIRIWFIAGERVLVWGFVGQEQARHTRAALFARACDKVLGPQRDLPLDLRDAMSDE